MDIKRRAKAARVPEKASIITGEPRVGACSSKNCAEMQLMVSHSCLSAAPGYKQAHRSMLVRAHSRRHAVALGYFYSADVVQYKEVGTLGRHLQVYTDETGFSVVLKDAESSTVFATVQAGGVTCPRPKQSKMAAAVSL